VCVGGDRKNDEAAWGWAGAELGYLARSLSRLFARLLLRVRPYLTAEDPFGPSNTTFPRLCLDRNTGLLVVR